jgi:hypothetical protein
LLSGNEEEASELGRQVADLSLGLRDVSELYNDYTQPHKVGIFWTEFGCCSVFFWFVCAKTTCLAAQVRRLSCTSQGERGKKDNVLGAHDHQEHRYNNLVV